MKKFLFTTAMMLALVSPALGVVVVNGQPGEDDGASPFETPQAAVKFAIATQDPVVEIQTNTVSGGITLSPAVDYLQAPLTIRAGAGFSPKFTVPLRLNTATPSQPITLDKINVTLPAGSNGAAVYAAGDITMTSCTVSAPYQGGGHYPVGIKCNLISPENTGSLTLTNCYVDGINGILAGHSIRDYKLTSCTVVGLTSDIGWDTASPVANIMNWYTNDGGALTQILDANTTMVVATDAAGTTAVQALQTVTQPRTLTADQCIMRSNGELLAWPPNSLEGFGTTYYGAQNDNTIGPVNITNTLFDGCNPLVIGNSYLEATQTPNSVFRHCTFRTQYSVTGAIRLRGNEASTHEFDNCLFDSPQGLYAIGIDQAGTGNIQVSGDGNIYYIKPGTEFVQLADLSLNPPQTQLPPFEATTHTYTAPAPGNPFATNPSGTITLPFAKNLVAAKAVPLTPPVTVDIFGTSRPRPAGAAAADVGIYEFDETAKVVEAIAYDSSNPTVTNPFFNVQDAVTFAVVQSLDTVELQTNTPAGGVALVPQTDYLHKPLTIKAGVGLHPTFEISMTINPATPQTTVTLENINISLPEASNGAALYAAGALVLNNCKIEANHVGSGHYPVGIACNIRSPREDGVLVLKNCLVTGHNAIIAGHSIQNYQLSDTTVLGLTSDLPWGLTGTVTNLMNWETNAGGVLTNLIDSAITIPVANGSGGTTNVTLQSIQTPRALTMNRCILRTNGSLLQWPPDTLESNGNYFYSDVNDNTIGPVFATNCLFDGCNPMTIGNRFLYPTQNETCTFTNCTIRTTYNVTGAVRFKGNDTVVQTFNNCLFDGPGALYSIGIEDIAMGVTLAGDGNIYHVDSGLENVKIDTTTTSLVLTSLPPFEATTHTYSTPLSDTDYLTGDDGRMLSNAGKGLAGGKAVAVVPAVTVDLYGSARPIPSSAPRKDVGAVEFDETPAAGVVDWTVY